MEVTDQKINQLKELIEKKKKEITQWERPNYLTNLSFPLNINNPTERSNLQVVSISILIHILASLRISYYEYEKIRKELNIKEEFRLSGFKYDEWEHDIKLLIKKSNIKQEKEDLKFKEERLNSLISEEERKRLKEVKRLEEIDEISRELGLD